MELQERLEKELDIYTLLFMFNTPPSLILMHPETWANLVREVVSKPDNLFINIHSSRLEYRTIPVYRSLEVQENIFIVA